MDVKNYLETVTANQTKLVETLSEQTNSLVALMTPEMPETMDKAAFGSYYAIQKGMMEDMLKVKDAKEIMEVLPAQMNKAFEANTALYNQVFDYYKGLAKTDVTEQSKTLVEKSTALYKGMFTAVYETATANVKAMQELF
jgi:hypothetical protein